MINTTYIDVEENLRKENERLQREQDVLVSRLRHLLQSAVIRKYDEIDWNTGTYKHDITELDQLVNKEFAPQETKEKEKPFFYICDRRACKTCSPECMHTTDIRHAENFKLNPLGRFIEKENKDV